MSDGTDFRFSDVLDRGGDAGGDSDFPRTVDWSSGVESRTAASYSCVLVSLGDGAAAARQAWVESVFGTVHVIRYAESALGEIARAIVAHQFLVVSGRDVKRIRRMMHNLGAVVANRPGICVVNDLPADRRDLLRSAGFAEVFDCTAIHPGDARCDNLPLEHWCRANAPLADRVALENAAINRVCAAELLTRTERRVIAEMVRADGAVVAYDTLRRVAGTALQPAEMTYLRVILSGIRKKLRDGVTILAMPESGYALQCVAESANIGQLAA